MSDPRRPRRRRRSVLLDVREQAPTVLALVGVCAVGALLFLFSGVAVSGLTWEDMTSTAAGRLALAVDSSYFLVVAVGVAWVGLTVTQRVIGPTRVLAKAVREVRHGQYDVRVDLRDSDFLRPLAVEVRELVGALQAAAAVQQDFLRDLEECVAAGDLERLQALAAAAQERAAPVLRAVAAADHAAEPVTADAGHES